MNVTLCVDALAPNPGGIGRYTRELCKGLERHDDIRSLAFFGRGRLIKEPAALLRGVPLEGTRSLWRRWWDERTLRSSIVHGPNYFLPDFAETGVITVHDLSVFRYPETHPADRIAAFEREFLSSLSRAVHVITDTDTIRDELIKTFSLRPDAVSAVPLGVDTSFRPQSTEELVLTLAPRGLRPKGYGLCVSTLEPRKKISELLTAWSSLRRSLRDTYPLVLCGGEGWQNDALRDQVRDGVTEGWLRHLGFVEEWLLPRLYAGAALFVYPSIYEGFGLPPLEAMACGVPVMTSRRSCLAEVCGNVARYVEPDDAEGFRAALEQNLLDVGWQAEALKRGVTRARQYSWERCVTGTVDIYHKVASTLPHHANGSPSRLVP